MCEPSGKLQPILSPYNKTTDSRAALFLLWEGGLATEVVPSFLLPLVPVAPVDPFISKQNTHVFLANKTRLCVLWSVLVSLILSVGAAKSFGIFVARQGLVSTCVRF